MIEMPTHCYSCGALLKGSLTKHAPGCAVAELIDSVAAIPPDTFDAMQCTCRTCGCVAADHEPDGSCLLCGRAQCWS